MECEEIRVDIRVPNPEGQAESVRAAQVMFQLNHTMPFTPEYDALVKDLFGDNIGEGSHVSAPISGACVSTKLKIGKNTFINSNLLAMARGGITIGDNVQIAANVQLISNNHDPYDRMVLTCKPVVIEEGVWIGAGATILPGVRVGKHAIVGAMTVVTKDVPDYGVAVGNPARVVKFLEPEKFGET